MIKRHLIAEYLAGVILVLVVGCNGPQGVPVTPTEKPIAQRKPVTLPKSVLICTLFSSSKQVAPGQEVEFVLKVKNPTAQEVPIVPSHVEYVTSIGTGVGISFYPNAYVATEPASSLPRFTIGFEQIEGAYPKKPNDIIAIVATNVVDSSETLEFPLTVRAPQNEGKYDVRGYIRSWAYYGARNGIPMIDQDKVAKDFVHKVLSSPHILHVKTKTHTQQPDAGDGK